MSKLKQLIQELCPNGVEYQPIWQLTAWDKKFNAVDKNKQKDIRKYTYFLAADLKSFESVDGDVKILTTSVTDLWANEEDVKENVSEGEIVCIPWGGNPIVQYYKGKFITGDNRIATSIDTAILDNKYLYYCLQNKLEDISSFYRGSGIKHPDMSKVLDLMVPIPPIEVQREIVRILDNFTELTAELTAEFTARKQQYEYYTYQLLNFDGEVKTCQLKDLIDFRNGKGHEKDIVENGKYIVVNSKFISTNGEVKKYSNQQICPLFVDDILMVMSDLPNGRALAKCYLVTEDNKYTLNQRIGAFHVRDKAVINTKFLQYVLNRNQQLLKYDNGVDQTNLRKDDILNISIPVPSLEEQRRIVDILDRFDALCNDLTCGLPAEIEARQKQYEYYRDQLLTFKEV